MNNQQLQKASIIQEKRKVTISNDSIELQQKRAKFLQWLCGREIKLPEVFEMYENEGETIYGKKIIPQYLNEYLFANTRTKLFSETRAEIDKLPLDKAVDILCEICLQLIRQKIHFVVFYAQGQRSPHVIIFDIEGLDKLTPFSRMKAQVKFWRRIVPFAFHLLDHSIWDDEHYLPLEFAIHWKHGTPFNLLFEYIPQEEKCKI